MLKSASVDWNDSEATKLIREIGRTAPASGVNTANITGVTVDPSSAGDFLPVAPLDLASPTEFTVNVANLDPAVGSS